MSTTLLLALFSLITLWAHDLVGRDRLDPRVRLGHAGGNA